MVWSNKQTEVSAGILLHLIVLLAVLYQRLIPASASALDEDQGIAIKAISLKDHELEELPAQLELKSSMPVGLKDSDSIVQSMREQIASAKKLFGFARLNKYPKLLRDLRYRIKEAEETVGASMVDADLPERLCTSFLCSKLEMMGTLGRKEELCTECFDIFHGDRSNFDLE